MIFTVIENIFVMFIFILIGFFIRKKNIIDDYTANGISKILINISIPAAIVSSMISQPFEIQRLGNIGFLIIVTVSSFFIFLFFGILVAKFLNISYDRVGIYACSITFSNVAFMGIPIIASIWGYNGVFYISIANIPFFILVPIAASLFIKGKSEKSKFKLDINVMASLIGFLIYISQNYTPLFILDFIRPTIINGVGGGSLGRILSQLSQLMTPLSMFFIGSSLAKNKISDIIIDKSICWLLFIKLIFLPLITLFFIRLFIYDEIVIGVLTMKTAMPTAALVAVFVNQKNSDTVYSSHIIFLTTLFSLITIPFITLFL